MSDTAVTESRAARLGLPYRATATWEAPDTRRVLQLSLAGLWLLDAILQYQLTLKIQPDFTPARDLLEKLHAPPSAPAAN